MTTAADRIRALIAKDFNIAPDRLDDSARLNDLGVDSIGMAEVMFNLEDAFGIKLPDDVVQLETFGEMVRYVEDIIAAQAPTAATAAPTLPP